MEKKKITSLKGNVTLATVSCDKYSELWDPHFHFLFKNWPELNKNEIEILLLSNQKDFSYPNVQIIKVGEDKNWSDNMLKLLEHVKTKYVVILLEDYIIHKPVDQSRLIEIVNYLEMQNGAYAEISLDERMFINGFEERKNLADGIKGLVIRSADGRYRTALQACIWNVDIFKSILRSGESPWQFEGAGSDRSKEYKQPFFMVTDKPVMSYLNAVHRGKYEHVVVDCINDYGYNFKPKALPIRITPVDIDYDHVRNIVRDVPLVDSQEKPKGSLYKIRYLLFALIGFIAGYIISCSKRKV